MLQPVGGMDRIAHAMYDQVKPTVRLNTPVRAIRRNGARVRIEHGPGEQATDADFCICTLPLPILKKIPSDFSPAKKTAISSSPDYLRSVKLAFEAPRFWETDDFIFGGLAWTDRKNENVIYPSDRYGAERGVIVGAYCAGWTNQDNPDAFARLLTRGAHSHQPGFDRGSASRTIAPPRQACLGRVGARALFGRGRCPLARLRSAAGRCGRRARSRICRAAQARRTHRLRRRAPKLSADLAGRRSDVRARRPPARSRPWPARKWLRRPLPEDVLPRLPTAD